MKASLLFLCVLSYLFFPIFLAKNSFASSSEAPGDVEIEVAFTKGSATGASIIYVIWIENETENYIQNLYVCNRLLGITGGLTGTALPYWKMNKYPNSEVDGVTGATQKNTDFDVTQNLTNSNIRQFTVYMEVDHSFDSNDWFYDQPALLYSVYIDLDNLNSRDTLLPVGWTRNDNLGTGGSSNVFKDDPPHTSPPIGELQAELRYITHEKEGTGFGDEYTDNTAAINIVGSLVATITIEPDLAPPTVPADLEGTAVSESVINLTWTASSDDVGVEGYRIYRDGNPTYIGTSEINSYSDEGLSSVTEYTYTVAAFDAAGNVSEQSTPIAVTTLNATNIVLLNQLFGSSTDSCFGALQDIVVAGDGNTVEFQVGSIVNLIAGESIQFLPGTYIHEGAYVNAFISTDGSFCNQVESTIVNVESIAQKSIHNFNEFEEQTGKQSIKVFPNPNNGNFTIKVEGFDQTVQIVIYNSLGAIIHQEKVNSESLVDIGNVRRGLYFVKTSNSKKLLTQKIIIR